MIGTQFHDLIGIGFGPSNLALAIALEERGGLRPRFIERQASFAWHGDMLLPGTDMQIAFVKDLVSLRDPTSRFSFLAYLHARGRLTAFLNLKTFNPSRVEFNDYLAWAAERFADRVSWGESVESVEPELRDGRIAALAVVSRGRDGAPRRRLARHVVVAAGGTPFVPEPFAGIDDRRVLHSSRYLSGIAEALAGLIRPPRIAVIGAGQSAAEIVLDAGSRFPEASVDLILRAPALRPADDSAFANEVFDPETVDLVHGLPAARRAEIMAAFRNTNYAVVDPDVIAKLYAVLYEERVTGEVRHRVRRNTETMGVEMAADGLVLGLRDRLSGQASVETYDAVVLATGYRRAELPACLGPLRPHLSGTEVDRNYRLPLEKADVSVHLQGSSEATHGLSDTLLSVLAVRAGEIAASIEAADAEIRPPRLTSRAVGA